MCDTLAHLPGKQDLLSFSLSCAVKEGKGTQEGVLGRVGKETQGQAMGPHWARSRAFGSMDIQGRSFQRSAGGQAGGIPAASKPTGFEKSSWDLFGTM